MVCRVTNAARIGKKEVNPRLLKVFVSINSAGENLAKQNEITR